MIQSNLPFENNDFTVGKLMAGILLLFVYFIPALISRDKKDFKKILIINLLTGWTILGWLIVMVWALNARKAPLKNEA
jgi:uncharacterized membrane protein